jgi:hypothetical protein
MLRAGIKSSREPSEPGGTARAIPPPQRSTSSTPSSALNRRFANWQSQIGNQAVLRALGQSEPHRNRQLPGRSHSTPPNSESLIAPSDSTQERHARTVGEHVRDAPAPSGPLVSQSHNGAASLTASGRSYFAPHVGSAVDRVRLHVDSSADRLGQLAGARGLALGDDVFIPRPEFAPDSATGRALLGHELSHVAQVRERPRQIHRDPKDEAHYPSETEQEEIEKLMGRHLEKHEQASAIAGQPPVIKQGRSLNPQERTDLAGQLESALFATLQSLDSSTGIGDGGLDEAGAFEIATRARNKIFERYGEYIPHNITLTRDAATTPESRSSHNQILFKFLSQADTGFVLAFARTIVTTHCVPCLKEIATLDQDSRTLVIGLLVQALRQKRGTQLQQVANYRVPGAYSDSQKSIKLRAEPNEAFFHTAVHELVHGMAHPAFRAAFGDEDNINEGFTEYFANEIVQSVNPSYKEPYEMVTNLRDLLTGPFHWPETAGSAEESLRQAYFGGRLDLIGWKPTSPDEQKAVDDAGGAAAWDPKLAQTHAAEYQARGEAAQAATRNVLGFGLFLDSGSGQNTVSVRYARVLAQSKPYEKHRLLLEGQVMESQVQSLKTLGGSIGAAYEYQSPYLYATGGARLVGTAGSDGSRIDVSPFVGAGVRAWRTVRVGVEGAVLIPLTSQSTKLEAGVTVGVEF